MSSAQNMKLFSMLMGSIMVFGLGSQAHSAIRINGNQLLDVAGDNSITAVVANQRAGVDSNRVGGFRLIFQVGQTAIGRSTIVAPSASQRKSGEELHSLGAGLSYDIGVYVTHVFGLCLIQLDGDVNISGRVTSADIIYLVGFVFKGGPPPNPCRANGDVNCSGSVTSADIIYLVGYVFKGGAAPCDICNSPAVVECAP